MTDALHSLLSHYWAGAVIAAVVLLLGLLLRRWLRPLGWLVLGVGLLLLAGSVVAIIKVHLAERSFEPRGELVDVNGYRRHILAEGDSAGGLTVVWIGGGHGEGLVLYHLHAVMREHTRSIIYDRPGTGWSDPGPFPLSTGFEAQDLAALLEASGEQGPFVLAGHSYGGLLAANFARRYPERTAAVVLLDPSHPDAFIYPDIYGAAALAGMMRMSWISGLRKLFGVWGGSPYPPMPLLADVQPDMDARSLRPAADFAVASIFGEVQPGRLAAEAPRMIVYDRELGDLPVYLIVPPSVAEVTAAAKQMGLSEIEQQRVTNFFRTNRLRYLRSSRGAKLIYTPEGVGHNYPYQIPEFVVERVRRIVDRHSGATMKDQP